MNSNIDLKNILQSDEWPLAVPENSICDESELDKLDRAEAILASLCPPVYRKKYLDFGCGEGHSSQVAAKNNATISVGYDIVKHWDRTTNGFLLTTDFSKVKQYAPYDVILLHDVLDHCKNPIESLKQIKEVCHKNTLIIIRCHPWCARHGGHCYRQINKAFVHLVLTDDELRSMGCSPQFTQKIIHPHGTYNYWFMQSSLRTLKSKISRTKLEYFFYKNSVVSNKIKKHWIGKSHEKNLDAGRDLSVAHLTIDFIDYYLTL